MDNSNIDPGVHHLRGIHVPLPKNPNSVGSWDDMYIEDAGNGKVRIDVYGKDPQGNPRHSVDELDEETYERIRADLIRKEQATLPAFSSIKSGNTIGRLIGETAPSTLPAVHANPPIEAETEDEGITGEQILDGIQIGLDVIGLTPVIGEAADIINAGVSLARGDIVGAGLSLLSAIPFAGYLGSAGKIGRHGTKAAAMASNVTKSSEHIARKTAGGAGKNASGDGAKIQPRKLDPGSPEHKAGAWERYQSRGGKKDLDAWSKQYDTNMRNYQYGLAREAQYRKTLRAQEGTLQTPITKRQIDILKEKEMYAGQLKTGKVSLTKENQLAIQKDALLVEQGWTVEHILEKGASKPYLEALEKAGIRYKTGPQIPQ
ncbi:hypothetical protein [Pseudomonas sp. S32]|uniref:hypothetical protein n=1 Tax=Pseudomonas sp. S32 TaxID=2767448 RepID=UPI0019145131|nr:hypothetical protein [Pseudomonas sp. S32]MBK5006078.1 hypothetical protein [Pseudomonas sp. S32]